MSLSSLESKSAFLTRFNPTIKIVCAIILLVLTFLSVSVIAQASILILVIVLWVIAKLPARKLKSVFISLALIILLIFLINWLVNKSPGVSVNLNSVYELWGSQWSSLFEKGVILRTDGIYWIHGQLWGGSINDVLETVKPASGSFISFVINNTTYYLSYSSPWYGLSSQVLINNVSVCVRIYCMLSIFSILVNTTSTMQMTYGFEHILWSLKWVKVPVTEISYIISSAIAFVPLLFKEANKILNALANRGVDYRNGRIDTKIKALGLSVVPVFGASFNYAAKLSDAMEARNFVPRAKRTKYRLYHGSVASWACMALLICLLALFIYLCVRKVIIYPCVAVDCFLV